jgi:hypothetical protein
MATAAAQESGIHAFDARANHSSRKMINNQYTTPSGLLAVEPEPVFGTIV